MKFTSFAYNIMLLDMVVTGSSWVAVRRSALHQISILNNPDSFVAKNVVYTLSDGRLRLCWDKGKRELACPRLGWDDPNNNIEDWNAASGLRECLSYIINTTL